MMLEISPNGPTIFQQEAAWQVSGMQATIQHRRAGRLIGRGLRDRARVELAGAGGTRKAANGDGIRRIAGIPMVIGITTLGERGMIAGGMLMSLLGAALSHRLEIINESHVISGIKS